MKEIEEYLNNIPMWADKKNSLADVRRYLETMDNPDDAMRIIHVAGTNGKGSVCSYLTSMLHEAGFSVGTFISPHLETARERFLVDGEMVSEEEFGQAFEQVKALADRMTSAGLNPPTYFEFLFYMAMVIFRKARPDFVILETGLGGRLDVTNVIRKPVLTVLTSLSMDHMQYLGNTLAEIAGEKAGIMKEGVPAVYDANCPESLPVIEHRAELLGCPAYPVSRKDYTFLGRDNGEPRIAIRTTDGGQVVVTIPSQAEYQMMNVTVAVRAVGVLRSRRIAWLSAEDVVRGIRCSYWPGRMEEVLPGVYLDGAHNEGGIQALSATICRLQQETGRPVSLMFGVMSDKAHGKMIQALCRGIRVQRVTIAHVDSGRSAGAEELAEEFRQELDCPVEAFDTVEEAWRDFLDHKGEGLAFCAGSLYLIGNVMSLLKEEQDHDRF